MTKSGATCILWAVMLLFGMSLRWTMDEMWRSMGGTDVQRRLQLSFDHSSFQAPPRAVPPNEPYEGQNLQFVLTLGLEGTGHHFMQTLTTHAPFRSKLRHIDPTKRFRALTRSLFHHEKRNGLWNAHCDTNATVNLTRVEDTAIEALKEIRRNYEEARRQGKVDDSVIRIPVNAVKGTSGRYGMQSYPNFWGECRQLNFPSLDLFYNACDKAAVDCRHVYIYRDPGKILASTTVKRDFNVNMPAAIHLYKTMLYILSSEMETYRSRTLGCMGFYEEVDSWQELIRQLWGWQDRGAFQRLLSREYRPPATNRTVDQGGLSPSLGPYLEALKQAHEYAIEVCRTGPNQIQSSL